MTRRRLARAMDRPAALPVVVACTRAVLIGDRFGLCDLVEHCDDDDTRAALLQAVHLLANALTRAHGLDGAHEVLDGLALVVPDPGPGTTQ